MAKQSGVQVTMWASAFHEAPVLSIVWNDRAIAWGHRPERNDPEGHAARKRDLTGGWFDPRPNDSGEAAASGAYGSR